MSKSNKSVKQELERIYGKGCFFRRAHIAQRIEQMGGIKTYKVFIKERHYKSKKISHRITLHHLKHRSEGGETSIQNGANVEETYHQYLHSLPREQEEIINNMLREFKINCISFDGNGDMIDSKSLSFDMTDCIEIPVYDNVLEDNLELIQLEKAQRRERNQREKINRLLNPTRAMKKRELENMIKKYEEGKGNDTER